MEAVVPYYIDWVNANDPPGDGGHDDDVRGLHGLQGDDDGSVELLQVPLEAH